jgi:hypothetical protein
MDGLNIQFSFPSMRFHDKNHCLLCILDVFVECIHPYIRQLEIAIVTGIKILF